MADRHAGQELDQAGGAPFERLQRFAMAILDRRRHRVAAIGEALIRGYHRTLPLSDEERAALPGFAAGACIRFFLSRAWDWLNTPADAMVTRKDPLAYWRRLKIYDAGVVRDFKSLA